MSLGVIEFLAQLLLLGWLQAIPSLLAESGPHKSRILYSHEVILAMKLVHKIKKTGNLNNYVMK